MPICKVCNTKKSKSSFSEENPTICFECEEAVENERIERELRESEIYNDSDEHEGWDNIIDYLNK